MLPYRHYWKFIPIFRAIVFGHCLILPIYLMSALAYGRLQRKEDAKYLKEYDPKAQFRPKWFKDEISWMKLNYYPHGYSADH
uniref:Uncharacterized protein n=1 Tax=Meloidogyne enterolobii TaxID=390850 RepID=A0A6V7YEP0_MELEN|nr:unnamed protein product [Meloidogyne enterolobii]